MKKAIKITIIIVLIINFFISIRNYYYKTRPSVEELDEMFHTDFESTGMYRSDDEVHVFSNTVYCLGGPLSAKKWSGIVKMSKSNNIVADSFGKESFDLILAEDITVKDVDVGVKLYYYYEGEFGKSDFEIFLTFSFNNENGYFGFSFTPVNHNAGHNIGDTRLTIEDVELIEYIIRLTENQK